MARRDTAQIREEFDRLAFFESDASDSLIRLAERFDDPYAFRDDLKRLDLLAMAAGAFLFGLFLLWFGLWPISLFFLIPGGFLKLFFLHDLITYWRWMRNDDAKFHARFRDERKNALAGQRRKLVLAQKARICEMAAREGVFAALSGELQEKVRELRADARVKGKSSDVESFLVNDAGDQTG